MALGKLIVEDRKYQGTEATEIAALEHYKKRKIGNLERSIECHLYYDIVWINLYKCNSQCSPGGPILERTTSLSSKHTYSIGSWFCWCEIQGGF